MRFSNLLVILTIILLWLKSIYFLSRTRALGVLIKTIFLMIKDLFYYIIILAIIVYSIGSTLNLIYQYEIPAFATLESTMLVGFSRLMGSFDF
jgi:hypothetical protein